MNRRASDETQGTSRQRGEAGDGTKAMLEEEGQKAREKAQEAAEAGKERLESHTDQAAESVDHLAEAVGSAASRLSEMEHESLADYANRLSSWLGDMSGKLRSKNVDEITDDIRGLAERNPAMFVLGSIAIGIGLSRFAKASSSRSREREDYESMAGNREWTHRDDTRLTGDTDTSGFESSGRPSVTTYESRDRNSNSADRPADRPTTPDSSGGGGL